MPIIHYTLFFLLLFLLIIRANFFSFSGINKWILPLIFVLKVFVSFAYYQIFTQYYRPLDSDLIRLFNDGMILKEAATTNPVAFFKLIFHIDYYSPEVFGIAEKMNNWYTGHTSFFWSNSRTLILFHALVGFVSFENIHIHNLIALFAAFSGQVALFKTFGQNAGQKKYALLVIIFLIPSVLFWSSAAIKESFAICGLGLVLHSGMKILHGKVSIKHVLIVLLCLLLLFFTKIHIFLILLFVSFGYIVNLIIKRHPLFTYLFLIVLIILFFLIQFKISPEKNAIISATDKFNEFVILAQQKESGSLLTDIKMHGTPEALLKYTPNALLNVFFRPDFFNNPTKFEAVTALENIIFAFVVLASFLFIRTKAGYHNLFWFCIMFGILNLLLIGYTVPVAGAIVRYKIVGYPFILIGLLLLFDEKKFTEWFS